MTRIWLNHWFSTAYNIIRLIKQEDPDFFVIGSNANGSSPIQLACDAWYEEPVLSGDEYVAYCLEFCRQHRVEVFLPHREMLAISREKDRFAEIGTKVMADDYDMISVLNRKDTAYELFRKEHIGAVPDYWIVTTAEQFKEGYSALRSRYQQVCLKLVRDEGGTSFRLIDDRETGDAALLGSHSGRISYERVLAALGEQTAFSPIMLMPYLPDEEVSVDCLKTSGGIIMIPRIKGPTRVERIRYDPEILDICGAFYEKVPLECPCNIQLKYLEGTPYMLEVNTRMSGGVQMACLGSGINLPNLAVNKLLGVEKSWKNEQKETLVSYMEIPVIL